MVIIPATIRTYKPSSKLPARYHNKPIIFYYDECGQLCCFDSLEGHNSASVVWMQENTLKATNENKGTLLKVLDSYNSMEPVNPLFKFEYREKLNKDYTLRQWAKLR